MRDSFKINIIIFKKKFTFSRGCIIMLIGCKRDIDVSYSDFKIYIYHTYKEIFKLR